MLIVTGSILELTQDQLEQHYRQVCEAVGLDPREHPMEYFEQIDNDGKRSLILYVLRNGVAQLSEKRGIKVEFDLKQDRMLGDSVVFYAEARDRVGHTAPGVGASYLKGLTGNAHASAIMTASTRAIQRAVLNCCGLGLLGESEIEGMSGRRIQAVAGGLGLTTYVPPPPAPAPDSTPAKEVISEVATPVTAEEITTRVACAGLMPLPEISLISPADVPGASSTIVSESVVSETAKVPPTTQDKERIKFRLDSYRKDTIQQGGMKPSKGFGIAAKWKKFLDLKVPDKTVDVYTVMLGELDAIRDSKGPDAVVAFIEAAITQ
jgi:hypothetical protein